MSYSIMESSTIFRVDMVLCIGILVWPPLTSMLTVAPLEDRNFGQRQHGAEVRAARLRRAFGQATRVCHWFPNYVGLQKVRAWA